VHSEELRRHCRRHDDRGERFALGVRRHADVAIGDHPEDPILGVDDGHHSDGVVPHDLCAAVDGVVLAAGVDLASHEVAVAKGVGSRISRASATMFEVSRAQTLRGNAPCFSIVDA
jgi:hypothetical protein